MDELTTTQIEKLRERDSELVRIIEALDALIKSEEWRTLKTLVFDTILDSLDSRVRSEADRPEVSLPELYKLQGEKRWARRYCDLAVLRNQYHNELIGIRKRTPGD